MKKRVKAILIVDDEPVIRTLCVNIVSNAFKFELMKTAEIMKKTLAIISEMKKEYGTAILLISDCEVPGNQECCVYYNLRTHGFPDISAVVMSGKDFQKCELYQENASIQSEIPHINKPFTKEELIQAIRNACLPSEK